MKKSEFKDYIKENIIAELSEADIKIPAEDLQVAKKGDTIEVTEEFTSEYQSIIGPIASGISKLEKFVRKEGDGADQFIDLSRAFNKFDEYMSYGNNLNEDEDAEPSDKDLKKKDSITKTANKLKDTTKEMKDLAKKFKAAKGDEKEKIKNRLKALTKIKKELEKLL
jgi:hypothetical protein